MTSSHAVVWLDRQTARVQQFEPGGTPARTIHAHTHHTAQHGSSVRTEHEFFFEVCDALAESDEVLVTGSHMALADFRHYVDKHRPEAARRISAYAVVDHPSDHQLVALARKHFLTLAESSRSERPMET